MKIQLTRIDNTIQLQPAPPYLTNYLRYTKRSMEMVRYKRENVYTKYDLYQPLTGGTGGIVTFRGFFKKISELVKKNGDELEVRDFRTPLPEIDQAAVMAIKYRDHQIPLMVEILDGMQENDGVVWCTMGSGKTFLMASVYAAYNNLNTIVAAPLAEIVKQTYKTFKELFPHKDIGLMGAGGNFVGQDVTICTTASIEKCSLEKCKLLLVDEIQTATSERMQRIITSVNAIRNIGFTATDKNLFNQADKVVTALFGSRLCEMDYADAEAIDAVVPGVVYFLPVPDMPRPYSGIDAKIKYGIKINSERNRLIGEVAALVPKDGQCMAFVDHVADHLVNLMRYMPQGTRFLHRTASKDEIGTYALTPKQQKETLQAFRDNEFQNLVVTDMGRAGLSIDNVRCVIQCSGGTSEVELLQEAGRGSRILPEARRLELGVSPKTHFVLVDFLDNHDETLQNMSLARRKIYEKQGWKIVDVNSPAEIDWNNYEKDIIRPK